MDLRKYFTKEIPYRTIRSLAKEIGVSYDEMELILHTTEHIIEATYKNKYGEQMFFHEDFCKMLYYDLVLFDEPMKFRFD